MSAQTKLEKLSNAIRSTSALYSGDDAKLEVLFKPCLWEFLALVRLPTTDLGPVDLNALHRFARFLLGFIFNRNSDIHINTKVDIIKHKLKTKVVRT